MIDWQSVRTADTVPAVTPGFAAGKKVELGDWTSQILGRELGIVRRDPVQHGFQAQPKRWVIERTLSWITATGAWLATTGAARLTRSTVLL